MEKKWYKKFKVLVGIATILIDVIILVVVEIAGGAISPEILKLMSMVFAVGITIITGHTITDAATALKSKNE